MVNAAVGSKPQLMVGVMPVFEGLIEGEKATVLRGTGCNTAAVRTNLVPKESYTGSPSSVFLLNRTVRYLPEAEISARIQFFMRRVRAKCVHKPHFDLI